MNKLKPSKKDLIFEELIKELQKLKGRGKEFNFGTLSTAMGSTEHTIEFEYKGYIAKVELKTI